MEKSCHSSTSTTTTTATAAANTSSSVSTSSSSSSTTNPTTTSSHIQTSLKSLNKASYKISKPLPKNPNPNSGRPSPPHEVTIGDL
ncbi:putative VQ motif-containing protein 9 [Cocos nucifera]|uniref:Putative VQ motif-containing protein 9 n=1 Tax=Cocos nucifera TaxID=13894 RepID=A0A8K0MY94_COCNU|nr:putative VQ motif-containing protein 9 [Cocos nucifera]